MPLPEPRADLSVREGYHSPQVEVEIRLNTNESPLPPPPGWVEALASELRSIEFNRYPDRHATALRAALADFHGVRPDQVFCGNGSNEVLQLLCLAYGGATRNALVFEPTYALHSHIAHITGTAVAEARRRPDFSLDVAAARDAVAEVRPAITFLCSPNNPTGLADDPADVRAILDSGPGLLVVDEAYGQFSSWSALDMLDDERALVVTRTFSKTWSMAGARLGYVVGPAPVVANLERVALPYHLDAFKQAAGRLALRYAADMEERIGLIVRERRRILAALEMLPVTTWPSEANFVLFRPESRKGDEVWQGLLERSILVRNASSWPGLSECLRVTVGTPSENDAFLAALSEALR